MSSETARGETHREREGSGVGGGFRLVFRTFFNKLNVIEEHLHITFECVILEEFLAGVPSLLV